jgi:rubrerythrin
MITKDTPLDEAWRLAIEREDKAYAFYKQAFESVTDDSAKKLFKFLMDEEERHRDLLQAEFDKAFIQEM